MSLNDLIIDKKYRKENEILIDESKKFLKEKNLVFNCVTPYRAPGREDDDDLHVLLNFSGTEYSEDALYNALKDFQPLDELNIDWNPINGDERGSNEEYLKKIQKEYEEQHERKKEVTNEIEGEVTNENEGELINENEEITNENPYITIREVIDEESGEKTVLVHNKDKEENSTSNAENAKPNVVFIDDKEIQKEIDQENRFDESFLSKDANKEYSENEEVEYEILEEANPEEEKNLSEKEKEEDKERERMENNDNSFENNTDDASYSKNDEKMNEDEGEKVSSNEEGRGKEDSSLDNNIKTSLISANLEELDDKVRLTLDQKVSVEVSKGGREKEESKKITEEDKALLLGAPKEFSSYMQMKENYKTDDRYNHDVFINDLKEEVKNDIEKDEKEQKRGEALNERLSAKYDMEEVLDAIEKEKFPIMKSCDNVSYIVNPSDEHIYPGFNQINLKVNNAKHDLDTSSYISLNDLYGRKGYLKQMVKTCSHIITKGKDAKGNYIFEVVVPCKVSPLKKRALKAQEKENYRRNKYDNKFNKRYGMLPVYRTALAENIVNQKKLVDKEKVADLIPTDMGDIKKRVERDMASYLCCMFTKEAYTPSTDWTEKKYKRELKEYVKNNPKDFVSFFDMTFKNVQERINHPTKEKERPNQMEKTKEREATQGMQR